MDIPEFKNRTPSQIINEMKHFESSGRAYRALSWLDYAKSNGNVSALEYSAFETRLSIEQLLFEQIIISVGTELDKSDYKKCNGNAKDLSRMVEKLTPNYEKLIDFTKAMAPAGFPITKWDNRALVKYHGKVSNYLHWSGGLDVTVKSEQWLRNGISEIETAIGYIWHGLTTGNTGVMPIEKLEPELQELWKLFINNKITIDEVVQIADDLEPVLQARLTMR
ncbi:MAG: hypothetical protein KJ989_19475 [Gammaproteobacteria bacterium]|nr:hypothetical protein [Gammaproteobacteria bacterium]MBU2253540.1 hypothetical protein [Gammaproteobacteria bacterium]MBU2296380.1 hypothetical protein [Gammaproteobacteria bacterium]